jgi:hypothetical protein
MPLRVEPSWACPPSNLLPAGTCPHHLQRAGSSFTFGVRQGHPADGHLLSLGVAPHEFRRDGTEDRFAYDHALWLGSLDLNRLSPPAHVQPPAVNPILARPCRIGVEDKDIRLIGAESGDPPGDLLVESDQDDGAARDPDSANIEAAALDVKLVEEAGIPYGSLRVAHQHRSAGGRLLAAHDPGVAEFRIGIAGTTGLARRQPGLAHPGVDFVDPLLRHIFPADNRRIIVYEDQVVLVGFMLCEIVIHPGAVGFEQAQCLPVQALGSPLGGGRESEHARETVVLQRGFGAGPAGLALLDVSEYLGHAALHNPKEVVHLKAPIFRTRIAGAVHRALVRLGKDMRHSPRIAKQLDPTVLDRRLRRRNISPHQCEYNAECQTTLIDRKSSHNAVLLIISRNDKHYTRDFLQITPVFPANDRCLCYLLTLTLRDISLLAHPPETAYIPKGDEYRRYAGRIDGGSRSGTNHRALRVEIGYGVTG